MGSLTPVVRPQDGDYLVIYPADLRGDTRIELFRVGEEGRSLVRATFAATPDAGDRFERAAMAMAQAAGTRAFRGLAGAESFDLLTDA
jgi:hypothetical protein